MFFSLTFSIFNRRDASPGSEIVCTILAIILRNNAWKARAKQRSGWAKHLSFLKYLSVLSGSVVIYATTPLRTVKLTNNNKLRKLWLLAVQAPELERLRESYGLANKLKSHDFHITIGTQVS